MTSIPISSSSASSMSSSSSASSSLSSSRFPSLTVLLTTHPFAFPKEEDTEEVWQKFLKDTTEGMQGVDPKDAQVIFLGNIHTEKYWQNDWRGEIVKRYGPDAIVLCEGWQACEGIPLKRVSSFTPKNKVSAYGWDDMRIFADNSAIRSIVSLNEKYKEIAPSSKWSKDDQVAWEKASIENNRNCLLRTHSMIKTARVVLREYLKPGQKLFVIAGSDHLFVKGYNVLDYFKGIKAALILPKTVSSNSNEDEMSYAKRLIS